jgi:hypothetical protein
LDFVYYRFSLSFILFAIDSAQNIKAAWHATETGAILDRFSSIFRIIMDEHVDVDYNHSISGITPLMVAAAKVR